MARHAQTPSAGFHSVTPCMPVRDCRAALDFHARAFGAERTMLLTMPDGSVAHAEIRIGDSTVMLSEENEAWDTKGPLTLGGSPMFRMVDVPDVDTAFAKAVAAGGTVVRPVADPFHGDRSGTFSGPYGHRWRPNRTERMGQQPLDLAA